MAALSGGEMCIKYLMFAFNLVFWVSLERREVQWGREGGYLIILFVFWAVDALVYVCVCE